MGSKHKPVVYFYDEEVRVVYFIYCMRAMAYYYYWYSIDERNDDNNNNNNGMMMV